MGGDAFDEIRCDMKISYDKEVDALSIIFRETTVAVKELGDGIALEIDSDGHVAGIEILDIKMRIGDDKIFDSVEFEGICPTA